MSESALISAEQAPLDPKSPEHIGNVYGLPGGKRCSANRKRGMGPCMAPAMENGKCWVHGGAALSGVAHPGFQGKGYAKILPFDLAEAAASAAYNPQILELNEEIGLVQARLEQLLGKITNGEGESSERWRKTKEQWQIMKAASLRDDSVSAAIAQAELDDLLSEADKDYLQWDDIYKTLTKLQSLIRQQGKHMLDQHALVKTEDALGFAMELVNILHDEIKDRTLLQTIQRRMRVAISRRPGMMAAMGER